MTRTNDSDQVRDDAVDAALADQDDAAHSQALAVRRETGLAVMPPRVSDETNLAYLHRLMELLPPTPDDVIDSIAGRILEAETPTEENKLWDSTSSKDAVGKRLIFQSVHILPSDYEDSPLDYFLVCKVIDCETGEQTVMSTGSVNIVAALVKAQVMGSLPWEAEIVGPKRVPKSGRLPLHLRWLGKVISSDD